MRWALALLLMLSARAWAIPVYSEDWEGYSTGTNLEGGVEDATQYWVDFGNAGTATVEDGTWWASQVAKMAPSSNWWGAGNTKTSYQNVTIYARVGYAGRLAMNWSWDGSISGGGTVPDTGQAYQHITNTYYGYASGGLNGTVTTTDTYSPASVTDFDIKIIRNGNDWYVEIDGDAAGNWTLSGADSGGFYLGAFGSATEYDDVVIDDGVAAEATSTRKGLKLFPDLLLGLLTLASPLQAAEIDLIENMTEVEKEHYYRGKEILIRRHLRIEEKKARQAEIKELLESGQITPTPTPSAPSPTPTPTPQN